MEYENFDTRQAALSFAELALVIGCGASMQLNPNGTVGVWFWLRPRREAA